VGGRLTVRLRIGVVGLGAMGRLHLRVLRAREDVEVVALVDPRDDVTLAASGLPLHNTLDPLLHAGLDACVVATPTDDHGDIAIRLADASVAALIEKPLASDAAIGRRVLAAFARAGVVAVVGHVERYNAAIRAMRERLAGGMLGEVFQMTTSRQGPFPGRIRDVGVVKDLATHDLDLAHFVTGARYVGLAARTAHRSGRPYEDLLAVVGWLADGTVTSHLVNWLSPMKERRIVVTGERGCLVADTLTADLTYFANAEVKHEWDVLARFRGVSEGDMIRYAIPKPEPLAVQLDHFLKAVRGEPNDAVSLDDGLAALTLAESTLESASTGQVVLMPVER
jgi:UDP-N-acetylglucosamine 3-dehydrogenase